MRAPKLATLSDSCNWSPGTSRCANSTRSQKPRSRPRLRRAEARRLFSGQLQRLGAQRRVDDLAKVAGPLQVAGLHQLLLHPIEFVHRDRDLGIDIAVLDDRIIDVGRAWIVGLRFQDFPRERNRLLAMGYGETQRLDLRRKEARGVVAPARDGLAGQRQA